MDDNLTGDLNCGFFLKKLALKHSIKNYLNCIAKHGIYLHILDSME